MGCNLFILLLPLLQLLEIIFNHLSVPDLLNCSLVNKEWRAAAGSVLWKHKTCFAYLNDPSHDLINLNSMLEVTKVQMINGLHFFIDFHEDCPDNQNVESLLGKLSVLRHWPFKYLYFSFGCHEEDCAAETATMRLAKEIFWASRRIMKEIAIEFQPIAPDFFRQEEEPLDSKHSEEDIFCGEKTILFPNLKCIKALDDDFTSDRNFYSFILNSAPNLTEITSTPVQLGKLKFWNETAMERLKNVKILPRGQCDAADFTDSRTLKKFARAKPSLHFLRVSDSHSSRGRLNPFPQSWFDPLAEIIRSSRYSLTQLELCASELLKFFQLENYSCSNNGLIGFPHVTCLRIVMPETPEPRVDRSILRRLNIGINFPKLSKLKCDFGGCEHEVDGEEYERDYYYCPATDLSPSLHLTSVWCYPESLEYFVNTFPLLTSLGFASCCFFDDPEHAYSFSTVFSSFPNLKKLKLGIDAGYEDDSALYFSLDAIFCGINFEEAKRLKSDTSLKLEDLKLVPARPNITYATSKETIFIA